MEHPMNAWWLLLIVPASMALGAGGFALFLSYAFLGFWR
jgi:hypothetical protein